MNLTLHDGRRTPKTVSPTTGYDYVAVLKEELHADRVLQEELMEACDDALRLLDLIDTEGFWETQPHRPRLVISAAPDPCDG